MPEDRTEDFEVFKRELMLTPRRVRVRLLLKIEEFITGLDPRKTYPFDYIFYCITEHRPESAPSTGVPAERVLVELARILDDVGRTVRVAVDSIEERVLSVEDLASRWQVSNATILRWREAGLPSRFFAFGGGRRKVGVRASLARKFEIMRRRLIRRARMNRRVGAVERREILEAALVGLARETPPSKLIADLAGDFDLRQVKVQRILQAAASRNNALLPLTRAHISKRERESIVSEMTAGASIKETAARWGRSRESVRKIWLEGRARRLMSMKLKYIHNEEFEAPDASEHILEATPATVEPPSDTAPASDLPVYLKGIAGSPLLSRDGEVALFRKYNFLKYLAREGRSRIEVKSPSAVLLEHVEKHVDEAWKVRERLVRSNLRLVVAIARRHHGRKTDFSSLVSDGNIALLDSIEAFDYARGNRFSTYAGWAIMRRFAKTVPEENYCLSGVEEFLENTIGVEVDYAAPAQSEVSHGIALALSDLPERERLVIEGRFALDGRAKPSTLKELGMAFGVTKERIRQIEAQALARMRGIIMASAPELAV